MSVEKCQPITQLLLLLSGERVRDLIGPGRTRKLNIAEMLHVALRVVAHTASELEATEFFLVLDVVAVSYALIATRDFASEAWVEAVDMEVLEGTVIWGEESRGGLGRRLVG